MTKRTLAALALAALLVPALPGHAATPVAGCVREQDVTAATDACAFVQPGGLVKNAESAGPCTLGFLFAGSDGRRYIATAGHCFHGTQSQEPRRWSVGRGPSAYDEQGRRLGEWAFWSFFSGNLRDVEGRPHVEWDLALIRLDASVTASPELVHFGGPTGYRTGTTASPVVMHSVGNGEGIGYVKENDARLVPARTFVATAMTEEQETGAVGYAYAGDSGSPVITDDGQAVGMLQGLTYTSGPVTSAGTLHIIRLPHQVALAERVLGLRLTLRTAPRKA